MIAVIKSLVAELRNARSRRSKKRHRRRVLALQLVRWTGSPRQHSIDAGGRTPSARRRRQARHVSPTRSANGMDVRKFERQSTSSQFGSTANRPMAITWQSLSCLAQSARASLTALASLVPLNPSPKHFEGDTVYGLHCTAAAVRGWRRPIANTQIVPTTAVATGRSYFFSPVKAVSSTSPIGCQVRPSNWIKRSCLIGWKSQGPVLILMPGSTTEAW